ncbi:MAG: glycosyltransferase family 39 protein [Deltaproteobacteria bacterium]|nr:glycosyltransferase family 39 protein [Deltaproteobacteria bacterium]
MKLIREDRTVGWIVLVFALSQLIAIGWDLPGAYGWENDGIAPRDFFAGIAINLTPGQGHRYPMFHNVLLGVLCIPILLPAALSATDWTLPALMEQILTVPVMTGCSLVAKLVAIVMACVSLLVIARIARRTVSAEAGRWSAIWAATCLSFAYYGRVSNLDGPYLMWTTLAIDRLITMAETRTRRDYILFGLLAGAAIATKDQAYAGFVLPGAIYLLLLPLRGDKPFGPRTAHYQNTAVATLAGVVSLGVLGGGFFNPTGFAARLRDLSGGASQDWMTYARTPKGLLANITDIGLGQETFYWPWLVVALCWIGVGVVAVSRGGEGIRSRTFRLLPLCAGLSSILFFTLVVARCEHRFVLPLGFWLAYYGGVSSAALRSRLSSNGGLILRGAQAALAVLVVWATGHSLEVHLTQRGDARNEVHAYLARLDEGTVVETYWLLVHLPHFDGSDSSPYRLQRVSGRPIAKRNPLVGAKEIDAPYGDVQGRRPDVLVVPESTALEFIPRQLPEGMADRSRAMKSPWLRGRSSPRGPRHLARSRFRFTQAWATGSGFSCAPIDERAGTRPKMAKRADRRSNSNYLFDDDVYRDRLACSGSKVAGLTTLRGPREPYFTARNQRVRATDTSEIRIDCPRPRRRSVRIGRPARATAHQMRKKKLDRTLQLCAFSGAPGSTMTPGPAFGALDEQVEVRCEVWLDRVRRHDGDLVVNGTGRRARRGRRRCG